jgi:hypothetical protein
MYFLLSENSEYQIIIIPSAKVARSEILNGVKKLVFLSQNGPPEDASQGIFPPTTEPGKFLRDRSFLCLGA